MHWPRKVLQVIPPCFHHVGGSQKIPMKPRATAGTIGTPEANVANKVLGLRTRALARGTAPRGIKLVNSKHDISKASSLEEEMESVVRFKSIQN